MAGPQNQQMGDGSDNYGQAAGQIAKAAKQAGQEVAKQTAEKSVEAGANAAAATVKAGVEGGKAVAEIAAGTAAGGPWGAILSAAWSLRHTLYKVLICLCLGLLFIIVMVVSLPSIVTESVFGLNGTKPAQGASLMASYTELSELVSEVVDDGYEKSYLEVEKIITDGGYDYDLSKEALINYAQSSAGYDVSYILAAYSASLQQKGTTKDDMKSKLDKVAKDMFPVTYTEKQKERIIPLAYQTYKPVTVTIVTKASLIGIVNGVPQVKYELSSGTYYEPDGEGITESEIVVDDYRAVSLVTPVCSEGKVSGTQTETYYEPDGEVTLTPDTEMITYAECTIHPFDETVIVDAFDLDLTAEYDLFGITYGEAIQNMANALKRTLYGSLGSGEMVPLTDAELVSFVESQGLSEARKSILTNALSLVGKVPYFWGGKSAPGWNDEWNTPKVVTAAGSSSSGTIRPFGLDCSGFTDWVYQTALGMSIGVGTEAQWNNSREILESELIPGDLGFLQAPSESSTNHVLIYAGVGEGGEQLWVHCESGSGVVLNSPDYVTYYRRISSLGE